MAEDRDNNTNSRGNRGGSRDGERRGPSRGRNGSRPNSRRRSSDFDKGQGRRSNTGYKGHRDSSDGEKGGYRGRSDRRSSANDRKGRHDFSDRKKFNGEGGSDDRPKRSASRNGSHGGKKAFAGKKQGGFKGKRGDAPRKSYTGKREADAALEAQEQKKNGWAPSKERTVRSKKEFDRARMEHMLDEDKTIYKGELDPRKKLEEERERRNQKAEAHARLDALDAAIDSPEVHTDATMDFRSLFEQSEASPARLAALFVTRGVRKRGAYAQALIETHIDHSNMSQADRAFATLLVLGVVSTSGTLDDCINRALQSPRDITNDVRDALRISTYEIIMLKKAPHAAVDQGVELVKAIAPTASRLGNAVLHRILDMKDAFPFGDPKTDIEALARYYAFPVWLAKELVSDMGATEASALMQASNDPAPLFIAVNSLKATDDEIIAAFEDAGSKLEPASAGDLTPAGCYRVANTRVLADGRITLLFSQGKILVSDASAQAIAAMVLEGEKPSSLLEVGAGRGTKTILMQSEANRLFGEQVSITSMDSHSFKSEVLEARAKEYGVQIDKIITGNATRLDSVIGDACYDTVFIDAPCSGLGTLRRHQEIRWRITHDHIVDLADTGLALLKSAASHVVPGGKIVYATCTVTYKENIGVVKKFLESAEGADFVLAPINGKPAFSSQLYPDSPDAHFAAKFVRKTQ